METRGQYRIFDRMLKAYVKGIHVGLKSARGIRDGLEMAHKQLSRESPARTPNVMPVAWTGQRRFVLNKAV
jgi:hypothetical protein